jgi:site-specific recombinase XerD
VILSKELDTITNIKHKANLMLMYSGGLRVGEVIKSKPEDMDGDRRLICTKASEGRRGRYTLLSNVALKENRHPEGYICEQLAYLPVQV